MRIAAQISQVSAERLASSALGGGSVLAPSLAQFWLSGAAIPSCLPPHGQCWKRAPPQGAGYTGGSRGDSHPFPAPPAEVPERYWGWGVQRGYGSSCGFWAGWACCWGLRSPNSMGKDVRKQPLHPDPDPVSTQRSSGAGLLGLDVGKDSRKRLPHSQFSSPSPQPIPPLPEFPRLHITLIGPHSLQSLLLLALPHLMALQMLLFCLEHCSSSWPRLTLQLLDELSLPRTPSPSSKPSTQ